MSKKPNVVSIKLDDLQRPKTCQDVPVSIVELEDTSRTKFITNLEKLGLVGKTYELHFKC